MPYKEYRDDIRLLLLNHTREEVERIIRSDGYPPQALDYPVTTADYANTLPSKKYGGTRNEERQ